MKVEKVVKCSSYFNQEKRNPYLRIPFETKRLKLNGKSFKDILEELKNN